jgi:hypothetical protein
MLGLLPIFLQIEPTIIPACLTPRRCRQIRDGAKDDRASSGEGDISIAAWEDTAPRAGESHLLTLEIAISQPVTHPTRMKQSRKNTVFARGKIPIKQCSIVTSLLAVVVDTEK